EGRAGERWHVSRREQVSATSDGGVLSFEVRTVGRRPRHISFALPRTRRGSRSYFPWKLSKLRTIRQTVGCDWRIRMFGKLMSIQRAALRRRPWLAGVILLSGILICLGPPASG